MTTPGRELARGRTLVAGRATGRLLVIEPLSLWGGLRPEDGRIIDVHHPSQGTCVTGTILAMPYGRGSSSAATVLAEAVRRGTAPAAVILASADVILVLGALVAAELYDATCPIVQLQPVTFARIAALDGQRLAVRATPSRAVIGADPAADQPGA